MNFLSHSSPLQAVHSKLFPEIELWVKRDDLLHPQVSGNKFRKLKYPISEVRKTSPIPTVISMGGPWSNHLHALAHAGQLFGFPTIGLVRGLHDTSTPLSATLTDCEAWGMKLQFLSRIDYRELRTSPLAWKNWIAPDRSDYMWLPEGGSSVAAIHGVAELIEEIVNELGEFPSQLITACGTGATLEGLVAGMQNHGHVTGIAAVQNASYLKTEIDKLLALAAYPPYQNFEIFHEFTHGGFAKTSRSLMDFCEEFSVETQIPVEPVYTGKMFYALHQLCRSGKFAPNEKVVAIHTGGLQGNRGYC